MVHGGPFHRGGGTIDIGGGIFGEIYREGADGRCGEVIKTHGQGIDPELSIGVTFRTNAEGGTLSTKLLPDRSAEYNSHRPDEFRRDVAMDWITMPALTAS